MIWSKYLKQIKRRKKENKRLKAWLDNGKPVPPPNIVKQHCVREFARIYQCNNFVETGTYKGKMIESVQSVFTRIYSIELDAALYDNARKKFSRCSHIQILHGDSGELIKEVLGHLSGRTLFWLDAHYSGGVTAMGEKETPIEKELRTIFRMRAPDDVILIDDARLFVGDNDYPTISALKDLVNTSRPDATIDVEDDIIQIRPRG